MKKIVLSITLFVSFIAYATAQRLGILGNQLIYTPYVENNQTSEQTAITPRRSGGIFGDDYEYEDDEDGDSFPRTNTTTQTPASPTQVPASKPAATQPSVSTNTGQYRNGRYTGSIADAYYGNVQVKAIISEGKISDVQFLDYPHDRANSIRINTYAMPILKQEAISAQNANVDAVSGATATSGAFNESLASALTQAKN